jgi:hypothetical protein
MQSRPEYSRFAVSLFTILTPFAAVSASSTFAQRAGLKRARSIGNWVKDYGIVLDL